MRTFLHRLVILCCALYLSGAHWMVLQTAAWTGMVVSRTIRSGVAEAVESTLDGKHPCRMCATIAHGQREEQDSQKEFALLKKAGDPKFIGLPLLILNPDLAASEFLWPALEVAHEWCVDAPPTPPPLA